MSGIRQVGKNIHHRRGDTGVIRVRMDIEGENFPFREDDVATLTIKKNLKDTEAVLTKQAVDGLFIFRKEDTINLPFGNYWYDIQVELAEGQSITIMGPAIYKLLPSVGR